MKVILQALNMSKTLVKTISLKNVCIERGVIFDRWKASNIVISIEYEACKANDVN